MRGGTAKGYIPVMRKFNTVDKIITNTLNIFSIYSSTERNKFSFITALVLNMVKSRVENLDIVIEIYGKRLKVTSDKKDHHTLKRQSTGL